MEYGTVYINGFYNDINTNKKRLTAADCPRYYLTLKANKSLFFVKTAV